MVIGCLQALNSKNGFWSQKSQSTDLTTIGIPLSAPVSAPVYAFLVLFSLWKPCVSTSLVHGARDKAKKQNQRQQKPYLTDATSRQLRPLLPLSPSFKMWPPQGQASSYLLLL